MKPVSICWFQNDSTKKFRLLCLEAASDGHCLWETTSDHDSLPEPRTDVLLVIKRPAHYADYEKRRAEIEANGYTIVTQQ